MNKIKYLLLWIPFVVKCSKALEIEYNILQIYENSKL